MPRKKTEAPQAIISHEESTALTLRPKSLVFISHDTRDAGVAEAFANLLSDVSGGTLKSFRSSDKKGTSGIEFGAEWYDAIMTKLGDATDVVALLTKQSIDRPWILYEAGVAKGKLNSVVFGVAIGVPLEKVTTGPFGQFQNCGDDEDSLTGLVLQLLRRNPDAAPREEAVRMQVQVFRTKLTSLLKSDGPVPHPTPVDEPSIAKLFEEVKIMVRDLPEKLEGRVQGKRRGMRRTLRFHPMMYEEILANTGMREGPDGHAAAWLMMISVFRDDLPWMYEIGLDFYRALRSKSPGQISAAKESFVRAVQGVGRTPFMRDFLGQDDEEVYMLLKFLPNLVDRVTAIALESGSQRRSKPEAKQ